MNRTFVFAAALAGAVLAPQFALAMSDDAMSHDAMAAHPAMMLCRAAKSDEKATAMTTGHRSLVCHALDMKKMMTGPDTTTAKTPSEADKAWRQFLQIQMNTQ